MGIRKLKLRLIYYTMTLLVILPIVGIIFLLHDNTKKDRNVTRCEKNYICQDPGLAVNISTRGSSFQDTWSDDRCRLGSPEIALIIPYRDRKSHLQLFVENIIPFLKAQRKSFTIFVVEQTGPQIFNRALLMNVGVIESQKLGNYNCFILHDVDMIPINLCNLYECPKTGMRHLGLSKTSDKPRLIYNWSVGGVSAFSKEVLTQINGFTNVMFGWGGEDDDAFLRLKRKKIRIHRYSPGIGSYIALPHKRFGKSNPHSYRGKEALKHYIYMDYDGLNTVNYNIKSVTQEQHFTRIVVSVPGPVTIEEARIYYKNKTKEFANMLARKQPSNL